MEVEKNGKSAQTKLEQDWSDLDKTGQDFTRFDMIQQDLTGLENIHQDSRQNFIGKKKCLVILY